MPRGGKREGAGMKPLSIVERKYPVCLLFGDTKLLIYVKGSIMQKYGSLDDLKTCREGIRTLVYELFKAKNPTKTEILEKL